MGAWCARLRDSGVTIILTTHYIEEAEEMADRIGVINKGEIILVEDKAALMRKLGKKQLTLHLQAPLDARARRRSPAYGSSCRADGSELVYTFDTQGERTGIAGLLRRPRRARASTSRTCRPSQSSLEDIFVSLVRERRMNLHAIRAIYLFEMARTWRTLLQSIVVAGDLDLALLRRVRLGDRLAHGGDRRRQLRRLHRAGPDHAVAADAEHLQRLVRHLLPEVHRHDLRAAVGAGLVRRDRASAMSARRRPSRSSSA